MLSQQEEIRKKNSQQMLPQKVHLTVGMENSVGVIVLNEKMCKCTSVNTDNFTYLLEDPQGKLQVLEQMPQDKPGTSPLLLDRSCGMPSNE